MSDTTNLQQDIKIPQDIRTFLEGILQDAGMVTLDDATREEMIKELFVRLDKHLTNTIVEAMPDEHIEEFLSMQEQNKPREELEQFIIDKIPNNQQVFLNAFSTFRDEYLGSVDEAKKEQDSQENSKVIN
ncbi:MAG TPA: DUF5663 domain-containing protein [Candidatus Nitrosocosmicus sp.]|nr:DUF5663 domain-containing protein [Candidatus Nitrosocosmicus sp.]